MGNLDGVVFERRNAVARDAMFSPARAMLAEACLSQGNLAGDLAEAVRAAGLLPNDVEAQLKAGGLLLLARRNQPPKAGADKARAVVPKSVTALVFRASAMAGLTDVDGSLRQVGARAEAEGGFRGRGGCDEGAWHAEGGIPGESTG